MSKAERIEVNGFAWNYQTVKSPEGKTETINLFDGEGNYVTEFKDHEEMLHFLNGVLDCGEGAVILRT